MQHTTADKIRALLQQMEIALPPEGKSHHALCAIPEEPGVPAPLVLTMSVQGITPSRQRIVIQDADMDLPIEEIVSGIRSLVLGNAKSTPLKERKPTRPEKVRPRGQRRKTSRR